MASRKIVVLIGSLRKESYSRKVAKTLMLLAPPTLDMEIVEIGQLAMYNQDEDENAPPPTYTEFRGRIKDAEGVLFVTPEYNRTLPAVLKNAIDVGSRPYGDSAWNGLPCAVVSVSPGAIGGFGANHCLRQSLVFLNMPVLQREAYVNHIADQFDGDTLNNDSTRAFLHSYVEAFAAWVERHAD
jgi:chromate reductase, NAD(P)H dehydrogenase (quinone)